MLFQNETEYFAQRAIESTMASRTAIDPGAAFAHAELAKQYEALSVKYATAAIIL
jgi:hypothetical protein